MMLRKIPLGPLLEILQDLFDNGTDFIDISGENNKEGEEKRDVIKITVKPEYLIPLEENDNDIDGEVHMDYTDAFEEDVNIYNVKKDKKSLSDEDINDLI